MDSSKVRKFMTLAGQQLPEDFEAGTPQIRKLGAQLLLSEVLEYVIAGLGVIPEFNGVKITDANALQYTLADTDPDKLEMLDGLADVAYTMFWNELAFGVPLTEAYQLVCDNNLEKFVHLPNWNDIPRVLEQYEWDCALNIKWPAEVVRVEVIAYGKQFYAVGKDNHGKVRKPSSYKPVDLSAFVKAA